MRSERLEMAVINVIIIVAMLWILAQIATYFFVKKNFGRSNYPKHATAEWFYRDYAEHYSRKPVQFFSGKNCLHGYIYGEFNTKGLIVFAHGIGCGHENYIKEILWMVDHGWRVFAYDATGSCESEGSGTRGLVQSALDLKAALQYVLKESSFEGLPICLMGHSWGGYAAAAALAFHFPITASVSISAYNDPMDMMIRFAKATMGKAVVLLYPFVWINQRILFGKYATLTALKGINATDTPILVIHGKEDELVYLDITSVAHCKKEMTNPNAKIDIINWKGQCGHGSIFRDEINAEYIDTMKEKEAKLSDEERADFFNGVDKALYNRPNERLLKEIDSFLNDKIQA